MAQANDLQAGNPEGEPAAALAGRQASEPASSQRGEEGNATEGAGSSRPDILVVEPPVPAGAATAAGQEASQLVECEQQPKSEQQLPKVEANGEQAQGENTASAEVANKLAAVELGSGCGCALATPGDPVATHAAAGSSSRAEEEGRDDCIKLHVPPVPAAAPSSATLASASSSKASRRTFSSAPKCLQGRVSARLPLLLCWCCCCCCHHRVHSVAIKIFARCCGC